MAPPAATIRVLSWAPAAIGAVLADVLAFFAADVLRYRRRIVRQNIADCFPHLTPRQRRGIVRQFYRNLADYFFQTIRLAHLSQRKILKHISFKGLDQLASTFDSGQDVMLYTSHFGNWEYIPVVAACMPSYEHVVFAHVARPLKNLWFNRFFHRLRSRFNVSVPMRRTARAMIGWRREGKQFIIGCLSDQKPGHNTRVETVDFLGRPTPFIAGTEDLARKFKCAVYYTDVRRLSRNRFEVTLVPMAADASLTQPGALTKLYAKLLTESIRRQPASYLWSHNRWRLPKH